MTELEMLAALPGLIPNEQGMDLAALARRVPPEQAIVEIGSYKGKSTCYLAYGAMTRNVPPSTVPTAVKGPLVWAVDPWDLAGNISGVHQFAEAETREAFFAAVKSMGYESFINAVKGFSTEVAVLWAKGSLGKEIGLLYIDGDHKEASVRADVLAWLPLLATHATLAFDDLDTPRNPGVRVVVDEIIASKRFKSFKQQGRLGVFQL
jgi:hypothetical protein